MSGVSRQTVRQLYYIMSHGATLYSGKFVNTWPFISQRRGQCQTIPGLFSVLKAKIVNTKLIFFSQGRGQSKLTMREFREVYNSVFDGDADDFVKHLFRSFDMDKDGYVDFKGTTRVAH